MSKIKKISALVLVMLLVVSVFSACAFSPEAKLKGTWRDSTGNLGYTFMDNNICKVTLVDFTIPVINIPVTAEADKAAYIIEKKDDGNYYITITYSIFAKDITEVFTFAVDGDVLTFTNVEDGSTRTLFRQAEATTVSAATTVA